MIATDQGYIVTLIHPLTLPVTAMFRQSGRIHHSLGGGTLAGFPFIQEPEIEAAPVYYNSIPPEVEQSEPEIVEIAEPEPEIQEETASEKDEEDREQGF